MIIRASRRRLLFQSTRLCVPSSKSKVNLFVLLLLEKQNYPAWIFYFVFQIFNLLVVKLQGHGAGAFSVLEWIFLKPVEASDCGFQGAGWCERGYGPRVFHVFSKWFTEISKKIKVGGKNPWCSVFFSFFSMCVSFATDCIRQRQAFIWFGCSQKQKISDCSTGCCSTLHFSSKTQRILRIFLLFTVVKEQKPFF